MYRLFDLTEFERRFSAYQHKERFDNDVLKTVKSKELSVIDGRRAQNGTMLLSKLKMSNQKLKRAIMKVDAQEEIPKDMCEQVIIADVLCHNNNLDVPQTSPYEISWHKNGIHEKI